MRKSGTVRILDIVKPVFSKQIAVMVTLSILLMLLVGFSGNTPDINNQYFLPLHTFMEFFSIVVALLVFAVIWNNPYILLQPSMMLLAAAFLAVGLVDFAHALSYPGMPIFVTPANANKSIYFWLAGRFILALAFLTLVIPVERWRVTQNLKWVYISAALILVLLVYIAVLFYQNSLPLVYRDGEGLTLFKIMTEYVLVCSYLFTAIVLWYRKSRATVFDPPWLAAAIGAMAMSEMFFASYQSVTDISSLFGHVYKVIAYGMVYYAIFVRTIHIGNLQVQQSFKEIQEREAHSAAVVKAAFDAIITIDEDQNITLFNQAAQRMFGYTEKEVLGRPVSILMPERYRRLHSDKVADFAQGKQTSRMMGRFGRVNGRRADGSEFEAEASIARATSGQRSFLCVTLHDISETDAREMALRDSEQRYYGLMKNLPGAVFRRQLDMLWHVSYISEGVQQITGYSAQEFLKPDGVSWNKLIMPDDLFKVERQIQIATSKGNQYNVQYRIVHANGDIRWVQESGSPGYDEQGQLHWLDGFIHDVTAQIHALHSIHEAYDALEVRVNERTSELAQVNTSLLEAQRIANLGSWRLDLVKNKWEASTEFLNILELGNTEAIGNFEAFINYAHPDERNHLSKTYLDSVSDHAQCEIGFRLRMNDGRIKHVIMRCLHEYRDDGSPIYSQGTLQDVTTRILAQEQFLRSHQLLETVFENIHVHVAVLDANLQYLRVNHAYALSYGKTEKEFTGRNFLGMVNDAHQHEIFQQVLVTASPVHVLAKPFELHSREGQRSRYWDWSVSPILDSQGQVELLVLVLRDVSRAIHAIEDLSMREKQLHAAKELLTVTIDSTPDWIFAKDRQQKFMLVNASFARAMGLHPVDIVGRHDSEIWPKLAGKNTTGEMIHQMHTEDQAIFEGQSIQRAQQSVMLPDSQIHVFDTYKVPLRDRDGTVYGVLGYARDISEQIQVQEQLSIKDAAVANTLNAIVIADIAGRIQYVNQAFLAMWGYASVNEVAGKPLTSLWMRPDGMESLVKMLQRHGQWTDELSPRRQDGSMFIVDISAVLLKNSRQEPTHILASFIDVTVRVQAMSALTVRELELRLLNESLEDRVMNRTRELNDTRNFIEAVIDIVSSLVVVLDRQGRIIRFNHACELCTGYTAEEVTHKHIWDFLLLPHERKPVQQTFFNLTAGKFPSTYENYWVNKNGELRLIDWSNTCLTNGDGEVEYVIATGVDITQRRRTEQALRTNEELFQQLSQNVREVFFVRDIRENKMIYISPAYEELWQSPVSEMYEDARAFFRSVHPDDQTRVNEAMEKQQIGKEFFNMEYRIVRPDNSVRWVWARTFPVLDEQQRPYRIAGLVEDITERHQQEEQRLEHARRQRDVLVREVHHRIKNNLQGVIGLLRQHATRQPSLQHILVSAITQLSTMAQVHGLQSKDESNVIALCDLVEAIAHNVMGLTGIITKPRITRHVARAIPVLQEEAVPLALILNELIFNSVKHGSKKTNQPVIISIDVEDQAAVVRIRNRPGESAHAVDFAANSGLGTGLSLVRALLPTDSTIRIDVESDTVVTELKIRPPVIILPEITE